MTDLLSCSPSPLDNIKYFLGKLKVLAMAQIVPPLADGLITENGERIDSFYLGYSAAIASYMCFEALTGKLAKSYRDEVC